jgi:hypothetical protein
VLRGKHKGKAAGISFRSARWLECPYTGVRRRACFRACADERGHLAGPPLSGDAGTGPSPRLARPLGRTSPKRQAKRVWPRSRRVTREIARQRRREPPTPGAPTTTHAVIAPRSPGSSRSLGSSATLVRRWRTGQPRARTSGLGGWLAPCSSGALGPHACKSLSSSFSSSFSRR